MPIYVYAQIVGQESGDNAGPVPTEHTEIRSLGLGLSFLTFQPLQTDQTEEHQFDIDRKSLAITFQQEPFLIYLDYSNAKSNDVDTKFLNVGLRLDIPILFEQHGAFKPLLPVSIYSDFLLASIPNNTESENLSISSLGIGAGVGLKYDSHSFDLGFKVVPVFAFSTQAFSAKSGTSKGVSLNAWLVFPNLVNQFGLALGYRYKYIETDFSENRFDYQLNLNAITLGVSF